MLIVKSSNNRQFLVLPDASISVTHSHAKDDNTKDLTIVINVVSNKHSHKIHLNCACDQKIIPDEIDAMEMMVSSIVNQQLSNPHNPIIILDVDAIRHQLEVALMEGPE